MRKDSLQDSFIWVCYFLSVFSSTDKIQALKRFLFPDLSQREHSNFVQVKGHKYLSFLGRKTNKFELPKGG